MVITQLYKLVIIKYVFVKFDVEIGSLNVQRIYHLGKVKQHPMLFFSLVFDPLEPNVDVVSALKN
jgi:hypothetical protein